MAKVKKPVTWEDCWQGKEVGPDFVTPTVVEAAWHSLCTYRKPECEITFLGILDALRRTGRAGLAERWDQIFRLEYELQHTT